MGKYVVVIEDGSGELERVMALLQTRRVPGLRSTFLACFAAVLNSIDLGARDEFLDARFDEGLDFAVVPLIESGVELAQLLLLGGGRNEEGEIELILDHVSLSDPDPPTEARSSFDR